MIVEYLGNDLYKFNVDNREFVLNISEMEQVAYRFIAVSKEKNITPEIRFEREYNKKEKIFTLFRTYYNPTITKKEVFKIIANELKISYKAVEKTYYKYN